MSTCVLCVGIGGSGTSAVAGVLHHLGVWMGHPHHMTDHPSGFPLWEDKEFYGLFQGTDPDGGPIRTVVAQHKQDGFWGWKNTLTYKVFPWLVMWLQAQLIPVQIVAVHRNPMRSAKARQEGRCPPGIFYPRHEAEAWMLQACSGYYSALLTLDPANLFHVDYDQLRLNPRNTVPLIAHWLGIGGIAEIQNAVNSVHNYR